MAFHCSSITRIREKINFSAQNLIFWNASEDSLVMVTVMLVFFLALIVGWTGD